MDWSTFVQIAIILGAVSALVTIADKAYTHREALASFFKRFKMHLTPPENSDKNTKPPVPYIYPGNAGDPQPIEITHPHLVRSRGVTMKRHYRLNAEPGIFKVN